MGGKEKKIIYSCADGGRPTLDAGGCMGMRVCEDCRAFRRG